MSPEQDIINTVNEYEPIYLDAIEARNDSKPGSKKETEALLIIDAIEARVSMLVFGDTSHTFSQCQQEVDMWNEPNVWETGKDVHFGRSNRYPIFIPSGTPVERRGRYWCIATSTNHLVVTSDILVRRRK